MIKRIEDLDFYELLDVRFDANDQDIRNAYVLAVATYHEEALASYGVLSGEERQAMLDRIEKAFETLGNADARKDYDALILPARPEYQQRAYFRNSTEKLEIEDAEDEEKLWDRLKSLLLPSRHRKKEEDTGNGNDHKDWRALQKSHYYYGEYLKRVREKRGLTLENMAQSCDMSPEQLRALEEEDYDGLPHRKELYRLIRRYAKCLGLDSGNGD
jgi:DnaJ-class molecular chaperone